MQQKKRIIAFIDWYLPGYKAGGGQRAFANMVSYLRDSFDFYIITRNTDFQEKKPYSGIESDIWLERNEGEKVFYTSESNITHKLYKRLYNEINPDFAYVNGVYSWKFSILPLISLKRLYFKNRIVLGTYGMLAASAIGIKKNKKLLFLKIAKLTGLYRNVRFHATSSSEVEDIKTVFGNCADIKEAPHLPVKELPEQVKIKKEKGELKLISIARISPEKNTLFALEKLRELGNIEDHIVFDLYGPVYDPEYWKQCKELIDRLPQNISVNYKGVIEGNKVFQLLAEYHCLFMPSRGENFGYVILESFMAGRPVLISDQTPWRNLQDEKCGWEIPLKVKGERLKDKSEDWTKSLLALMEMEQEEFNGLCKGARSSAEKFINNPSLKEGNVGLFV
ncbi:glycosyltransferase family 4 protein [Plebeiibacterium sediminum]|uniref:Glycosyltransferase n=1 Tax=Plebeiibacterium sediminum TaxID=2992112 RepID=A0AAE3M951_9BACT|nr:glycosyltransferase [Plebeiobacterium sediminum]MCW3789204.1 glycosyltransferase [Plebeiobacterium sediminum]